MHIKIAVVLYSYYVGTSRGGIFQSGLTPSASYHIEMGVIKVFGNRDL